MLPSIILIMSLRIDVRSLMLRWKRVGFFPKIDCQLQKRQRSVLASPLFETYNINGVKGSIQEVSMALVDDGSHRTNERNFSSRTSNSNLIAFPSYNIFGETCVLNIQPIMPKFKSTGQDGNILNVSERGRMMFSFIPSTASRVQWNNKISFALSPEELGLLTTQIPFHPVTFTRELKAYSSGMNNDRYASISDDESVSKTLTIIPVEGAAISFEIDYKKNGVGGQIPPANLNENYDDLAPLNIVVQTGEWEVLRLAVQESIPLLIGWTKLMDVALNNAVAKRS